MQIQYPKNLNPRRFELVQHWVDTPNRPNRSIAVTKSTHCKRSLRDFLCFASYPNHFVLARANNRNVIITTNSSRPLFKQIEIFSILTVWLYISTVNTSLIYARVTRVPSRDFAFWAKSLRGQLIFNLFLVFSTLPGTFSLSVHHYYFNIVKCQNARGKRTLVERTEWLATILEIVN